MAISTVTNRVNYQGDGTSAVFAFQYEFQSPSDLAVFSFNSSLTPAQVQTYTLNAAGGFGYTISGNLSQAGIYPNGGSVIFNSAPNVQTAITIFRSSAVVNNLTIPQTGPIPSTGLNNELNYLTTLIQRLQDQVTRSVRLNDGIVGTFDPTLPVDFKSYPLKPLVLNSSCTGWIFDPTTGAYIPNTLIYAVSSTAIGSLGGAGTGFYLQSNGSSPPSWGVINISSAAVSAGAITGVLPQTTGGTGNTSYILGGLIFQETPIQFGSISTVAPPGYLLTANSGTVPSFQSFAANNINSGTIAVANGGTGVNQITPQFSLLVASSTTEVGTVPSATAGYPLLAQGSSVPVFSPLDLSGTGVANTLPVARGGIGVATIAPQFGILYASSLTEVAVIPSATNGWFLRSGGSSAPTYAGLQTTDILSGTFSVARGGTGTGTGYIQYGVVFASSATQMANTAAGGGDVPLVGNAGAAPSFKALNLASGSSVTGTLPTGVGGTGRTSFTSGGVLFGSSTTAIGQGVVGVNQVVVGGGSSAPTTVVGYGSSAHVLTSNGDGLAPTWQPQAAGSLVSPTSVSANYNATTSDVSILANSSNYTINLYGASGNAGRSITIKRTGPTFNTVIIRGSSASIDGTSIILATQYESVVLLCDGTNWSVANRTIPNETFTYTPTGSWSGNVVYSGFINRVGKYANVNIKVSTLGTGPTGGQLTVNLPPLLFADGSAWHMGGTGGTAAQKIGFGAFNGNSVGPTYGAEVYFNSSAQVAAYVASANGSTFVVAANAVTPIFPTAMVGSGVFYMQFAIPIQGWQG